MSIPVHAIGDEQIAAQKAKASSFFRMFEEGNFEQAEKVLKGLERDDTFLARLGLVPKEVKVKR